MQLCASVSQVLQVLGLNRSSGSCIGSSIYDIDAKFKLNLSVRCATFSCCVLQVCMYPGFGS
jgi:hypothetical protein